MDADRSREPLNDRDVDRELQSLLSVDPSPEFVARIRSRIASEPDPRAWWWSWKFAVAAVAAAAIVVIALVLGRSREQTVAPQVAKAATPAGTSTTSQGATPETPTVASAFRRTGSTTPEGPANRLRQGFGAQEAGRHVREPERVVADVGRPFEGRREEPEILLDARETAALRALIRGVRRGDLDLEPVLRASTPSAMELPPIGEIAIAPITIAPLEEGVRQ
jgi:hypothetical protein